MNKLVFMNCITEANNYWFSIFQYVHTERLGITRIISARKATPKERKKYYEYLSETLAGN